MKKLRPWISSKVIVKNPAIHNKGCFAKKSIQKNEIVAKMGGYFVGSIVSWLSHILYGDYGWQISKNRFLVPLSKKDLRHSANYINHSCNPNLGIFGERTLVVLRDIKPGEELTFDYAMVTTNEPYSWFPIASSYYFKCLCGASNCRKLITGEDWKSKDLRQKYAGYFSSYITGKIRKLNSKH